MRDIDLPDGPLLDLASWAKVRLAEEGYSVRRTGSPRRSDAYVALLWSGESCRPVVEVKPCGRTTHFAETRDRAWAKCASDYVRVRTLDYDQALSREILDNHVGRHINGAPAPRPAIEG